ncbi:hypothetical protein SVAN01_00850 [Stagonosporopsis vannaccii]|nr:hypothetical protein SVAN01_00850 [Stagonosporopsis vannaccii]
MAASPRKRLASPRKRLPPAPFTQTWHETDTAQLDPSALPVARIPRGWERRREVKQLSEGKAKSIWRRFSLRSSATGGQREDETEDEEREAHARAVKRRQKMSPKAMEKMQGSKRAFQGTRWERRKSVLPRKKAAHTSDDIPHDQSESDGAADADMSLDSLAEAPHARDDPSSFPLAIDAAQAAEGLPDCEGLDEQGQEHELGSRPTEDSTFALIFKSPVKSTSAPPPSSPAKVDYPALPNSEKEEDVLESPSEHPVGDIITVTGPTVESVVAEVVTNVSSATAYVPESDATVMIQSVHASSTNATGTEPAVPNPQESASLAEAETQHPDAVRVAYPALPTETASDEWTGDETDTHDDAVDSDGEDEDADMSEVELATFTTSANHEKNTIAVEVTDEEITEASLQLDIQDEYEREGEIASQPPTPKTTLNVVADIAEGLSLTLTSAQASSKEHTPKRLHSPPPPLRINSGPDDATMTLAIDDDTAILKSFLSRAAASKAERSAMITRRSSLENRRDSDIVRHALASPRKALEEKDPNSPAKVDSEVTLDITETAVPNSEIEATASPTQEQAEDEDGAESKTGRGSRRSSRAKKSRLPAPSTNTQAQTNKIAIRRADGSDPVVLKKTDAQELALITRNNTRKNKQGAFMVSLRLLKLQAEAILSPSVDLDAGTERPPVPGRRGIRWDETLAYYQEHADTIAARKAEAESLATPDELSLPVPAAKNPKTKTPTDKNSTPKVRRVRGLGTANGTPGKGLLATGSLLPDAVQEENTAAQLAPPPLAKSIPKPKTTRKLPVPAVSTEKLTPLDLAPVGLEPSKERKSRIAPPKSVRLPKPINPVVPVAPAEKENARSAISAATPRKGIPAPRIVAPRAVVTPVPTPAVGVESGLPRRRGRKM